MFSYYILGIHTTRLKKEVVGMKRVFIFLLVFTLILSFTVAYGDMASKLHNHWSRDMIDRSFLAYYFPYLARNNFEKFDPRASISSQDFKLSTASLLSSYGYEIKLVGADGVFLRKDLVEYFDEVVGLLDFKLESDHNLQFKDIDKLNPNSIRTLKMLNKYNIVQGDTKTLFSPNRELSQAEAVIVLQRVKEALDNLDSITFNVIGFVQSFDNQEEMVVNNDKDRILVTITKQFPTPGYMMDVKNILRTKEGYMIKVHITNPEDTRDVIQVITYQTLTIEIPKEELDDTPYNFYLEGYNKINS